MQEAALEPMSVDRFADLLPVPTYDDFGHALRQAARLLQGRTVWNINGTLNGGGVAELMNSTLPYLLRAGIRTRWLAVETTPEFLDITKRIHNWLHGFPGDDGSLGMRQKEIYDEVMRVNAAEILPHVSPGDVVIVHDPQPAGLLPLLNELGVATVWHCHIGTETPDAYTRQAWRFLHHEVGCADTYIFSRAQYLWDGLDSRKLHVIQPSIDPFSDKNRYLTRDEVDSILREWVPLDVPLVVQAARWDRLKDHAGVMRMFADHLAHTHPGVHLVVAGPEAADVADDPEGAEVFAACSELHASLEPEVRRRVHLLSCPTDNLLVNALQRKAEVVVQKSQAEGFGLVISEAMWKRRPVVASRVGGIQDQIEHGRSGILIDDPTDGAAFARAIGGLLDDPRRATRLGVAAEQRVIEHFLTTRQLTETVRLLSTLRRPWRRRGPSPAGDAGLAPRSG